MVLLIDNHMPFGFHFHPGLPSNHDEREDIHASDWQMAWEIFDRKLKELFNGP